MSSDRSLLTIAAGIVATAVLAIVVVVVLGSRPSSSFAEGSPEAALQAYVTAWEDEDYDAAYGYFSKKVKRSAPLDQYRTIAEQQGQFGYGLEGLSQRVLVDKVEEKEGRVSVYLVIEQTYPGFPLGGAITTTRIVHMVSESGQWKVDDALLGLEESPFGPFPGDFPGDFPPGFPEPSPEPSN